MITIRRSQFKFRTQVGSSIMFFDSEVVIEGRRETVVVPLLRDDYYERTAPFMLDSEMAHGMVAAYYLNQGLVALAGGDRPPSLYEKIAKLPKAPRAHHHGKFVSLEQWREDWFVVVDDLISGDTRYPLPFGTKGQIRVQIDGGLRDRLDWRDVFIWANDWLGGLAAAHCLSKGLRALHTFGRVDERVGDGVVNERGPQSVVERECQSCRAPMPPHTGRYDGQGSLHCVYCAYRLDPVNIRREDVPRYEPPSEPDTRVAWSSETWDEP